MKPSLSNSSNIVINWKLVAIIVSIFVLFYTVWSSIFFSSTKNSNHHHHHKNIKHKNQNRAEEIRDRTRLFWNQQQQTSSFLLKQTVLDTLILMNIEKQANEVFKDIIGGNNNHNSTTTSSSNNNNNNNLIIDTYLGSLLGAYSLTREERLLDQAVYYFSTVVKNNFLETIHVGEGTEEVVVTNRILFGEDGDENVDDNEEKSVTFSMSEIFSSILPIEYLLHHRATTNSAETKSPKQFQDWCIKNNILSTKNKKDKNQHEQQKQQNVFPSAFMPLVESHDIGLLPCFFEVSSKKNNKNKQSFSSFSSSFKGSISVTNHFGKFQLESFLKQWILFEKEEMITHAIQKREKEQQHLKSAAAVRNHLHQQEENENEDDEEKKFVLQKLYENAVDSMFKLLVRYQKHQQQVDDNNVTSKASSTSSFSFFPTLGEVTEADFFIHPTQEEENENEERCRIPGTLILGLIHGIHYHRPTTTRNQNFVWNETDVESFASDLLTTCVSRTLHDHHNKNRNNKNGKEQQHQQLSSSSSSTTTIAALMESLFYFYRFTQDEGLRETAWFLFERDVLPQLQLQQQQKDDDDDVEILLSRTLKFLFLIFNGENVLALDEFVFDVSGHPYRI